MFYFKRFYFNPKKLDDAAILTVLEILKLVNAHRAQLFDDFAPQNPTELLFKILENKFFWIITSKAGQFAGFVFLYDIIGAQNRMHSASISTCFAKAFWGKPCRVAGRMFIKHIFQKLPLSKLKGECFASNPYVQSFMRNLNFKKEGTLRDETIVRGRRENLVIWAKYRNST